MSAIEGCQGWVYLLSKVSSISATNRNGQFNRNQAEIGNYRAGAGQLVGQAGLHVERDYGVQRQECRGARAANQQIAGKEAKAEEKALKLKKGDRVRWELLRPITGHKGHGKGKITKMSPALDNCPLTYEVDTYKEGVLFADEVRKA